MPLLDPDQVQVLFKSAIKIYRKNPTCFLYLFTDMQHNVLHQKPGVAHLQYPKRYSSTHTGLQHFGISVAKASGSPSLARSDLAVPNQGLRRGAFATRHKPLDRQSFQRIGDN